MRSTSAVPLSYHCHRIQSNDEKPQPGFAEQHSEQFNGQLHSAMNPGYLTPASYQMQQNQNHGFGVQQSLMTNNGPFYHSVKNTSYSTTASYPMHQNRTHGFAVQQSSMINNRPLHHPLKDPICSTPASYPMHQNQNYGFGVPQSSMTNNRPFYYPGFTYHPPQKAPTYSVRQPAAAQAQEALTYPVRQPATAQAQDAPTYLMRQPAAVQAQEAPTYLVHPPVAAQAQESPAYLVRQPAAAQAQQVELNSYAEEEVLDVKLEVPIFPMGKPRLKWTPELHERFIRATTQLGGVFKATPKAILKKMNKTRCKNPNDRSVEEVMGHGIQNNADSHAPFTEDDLSSSYRPDYESDIGKFGSLLKSSETPNYQQNLWITPVEDHDNYYNFKRF
ncbi:hypothetical protein POM88_008300 [Heracleum sosnowskyi]|uniref:Uncharacterized protein n=1 Tax=Heracleum sosnowskyi TaxID=360622 RepID=A0AAD8J651_9APIA|nr:hypothetical protein POM88_008300 [Heracleum sosnowskyi]